MILEKRQIRVAMVTDGDTFRTSGGDVVRLARVSAPGLGEPGRDIAIRQLKKLIEGKIVTIYPRSNFYKRYTAEVSVDGMPVNDIMRTNINVARAYT